MKARIFEIKRFAVHDGDGIRTTVFLKGCPLKCVWCHNPESISFESQIAYFAHKCIGCGMCASERNEKTAESCPTSAIEIYGREYELNDLVATVLQDEAFFKNGGGVTLSGGECLAQPDFAVALARALYDKGISVYVDTCGFVKRETLERIIPYTDKFLYDIKAVDSNVHKKCTGRDNRLILDNLQFLCDMGCSVEIRYPLVMGYNDCECNQIGELLSKLKVIQKIKVLQYHAFSASRYEALGMTVTLPNVDTEFEDVENAVQILRSYDLNAVNGMLEN